MSLPGQVETTRSEDAEARRDDHATVVAVVREELLGLRKEVTPRRRGRLPRTGRGSRLLPQVVERTRERDELARKVAYESQVHRYAFLFPRSGSRRCGPRAGPRAPSRCSAWSGPSYSSASGWSNWSCSCLCGASCPG